MAVFSRILNRIGDLISKPSRRDLERSYSKLLEQKNHLLKVNVNARARFDQQYNEVIQCASYGTSKGKIFPGEYREIERLCSGFLTMSKDEIETEKMKAMEQMRSRRDRMIDAKIMLLATTALEIAGNKEKVQKLDEELNELKNEIARLKKVS
ncbi:MAG: hypothetical protein AABX25_05235 [Nanoarchaeota archaeon]